MGRTVLLEILRSWMAMDADEVRFEVPATR
jgi:hypothetical protein